MRTIVEAAASLRTGTVSASELVEASLAAIGRDQDRTRAFITIDESAAREAARRCDDERAAGRSRGPLHGIPLSIKDLIDIEGYRTTAASRVLAAQPVADADAEVITRLRRAGAIFVGKTNLHEFALGTTSEETAFGAVRNPLDVTRSAGGSSGGSAAAIVCGMGLASIGSDTGGSIRIPSAACGLVGLKPSAADVPTDGVIPLSTSFDHVGPLAWTVADAAILWSVLADRPLPALDERTTGPVRVLARLRGPFDSPVAPDVRAPFEAALDALARSGTVIKDVQLPAAAGILEAYVNVVLSEAAAWHAAWLDSRGADYTPLVRARLESGRSIAAVKYIAGLEFCRELRHDVDAALVGADAIVLPTLPITAPPLGSEEITIDPAVGDRTPVRAAMLKHTQPFNMTGHPAITLPLRTTGLPAGLQLAGRRDDTAGLLAIAAACEKILRDA